MAGTKWQLRWIALMFAGAGMFLAVLTISNLEVGGVLHRRPESAGISEPDESPFRRAILRDRTQLFDGELDYDLPFRVRMGDDIEVLASITAVKHEASLNPPAPGHDSVEREFRVGGVQKAYLSDPGDDLVIKQLGSPNGSSIAAVGDSAQWRWYVTPRKPGSFTLDLVIETYQRDTDVLLARTEPPVNIAVTVTNTWKYRISSAKEWLFAAAAVLAALGAISAFFRKPLTAFLARFMAGRGNQP
ncbi:hypothetical protein [Streptomyces sp. NBC_00207]|uniref:hypothetical protein n=1 Tax=Streptomyces sp. NBC_00207 TaxID=2903635 RepID=UPI00324CC06F